MTLESHIAALMQGGCNKTAAVRITAELCGVRESAVYAWLSNTRNCPLSVQRLLKAWHMLTAEQRAKL